MLKLPQRIADALIDAVPKILCALPVKRILLFGSYSSGTYNSQSDVDIAVFVEDGFVSLLEAYRLVNRILGKYQIDFQPQVFHEGEMAAPIGIFEEIFEHGIDITDTSVIRL